MLNGEFEMLLSELKSSIPDYAKDLRLNLESVLSEGGAPSLDHEADRFGMTYWFRVTNRSSQRLQTKLRKQPVRRNCPAHAPRLRSWR